MPLCAPSKTWWVEKRQTLEGKVEMLIKETKKKTQTQAVEFRQALGGSVHENKTNSLTQAEPTRPWPHDERKGKGAGSRLPMIVGKPTVSYPVSLGDLLGGDRHPQSLK